MNLQDLVINNTVKIEQDAQANTITIIASDSSEKLSKRWIRKFEQHL